jgi:hypothetical protein
MASIRRQGAGGEQHRRPLHLHKCHHQGWRLIQVSIDGHGIESVLHSVSLNLVLCLSLVYSLSQMMCRDDERVKVKVAKMESVIVWKFDVVCRKLLGIGYQKHYCATENKIHKFRNKLYEEQTKNNAILK